MSAHDRGTSREEIRRFGRGSLTQRDRGEPSKIVERLVAESSSSVAEFQRYLGVRQREITLPSESVAEQFSGKTVLVTGNTGCIGSVLVEQLIRFGARRIVGASRTGSARPQPGVRSARLDVRDGAGLQALVDKVAPDVVFHLAAQRDPGLAERTIARTVTTNVLGTRNVVRACERAGVTRLVYASTGKALRPYTTCVYAASKRISERIVADAARHGILHCSAVRFTHVVNNAILLERLRRWCQLGEVIRLHDLDTDFYAQSVLESAQLLLVAALAPQGDALPVHSIRNLDWPVNLLDLALGAVVESGAVVPIQEIGCDPGYEEWPYPGLYDPAYSGAVSPLFNAIEAPTVQPTASPEVDAACSRSMLPTELVHRIDTLNRMVANGTSTTQLRATFDQLALADLRQTAHDAPLATLRRITKITEPYRPTMLGEHRQTDDVFREILAMRTLSYAAFAPRVARADFVRRPALQ